MKTKILHSLEKILVLIINVSQKLHHYITSRNNANKSIYEPLTPSDNVDPDETYCKAIVWSIQHEEIKNVALSGPYGSGKSSLLKTLEKNNSYRYDFLNISLLTTQTDRLGNEAVEYLEKSILQQMFYKVKEGKIPFSRFKRISNIKNLSFFSWLITSVLFLLCMIEIFKSGFLKNLLSNTVFIFEITNQEIYKSVLVAYSITFLIIFMLRSYKMIYKNLRLSKISHKNITLEVMSEKSVFSKYIDEILYFFEATKYNVVFFEDLDRFKNMELFENLRELNSLINNSDKISRKVTFIYAIKDDLFSERDNIETSRNRTKFFDFIVPVVPIINSSNSGEVLKQKLEIENIGIGITENFISDITIYIDDMRILKNIINEYVLYKNKLGSINLIPNNLLAMIVYKNIYPSDFAKLQFNEGIIYDIFQKKNELLNKRIAAIAKDIEEIELKIIQVEQENFNTIEDLTTAYAFAIFGFHNNVTVTIDGTNYNHASSASTVLTNIESISNIRVHRNGNWSNSSKEELLTAFNTRENFNLRKEAITIKNENRLNVLKVELEKLKTLREEVKLWSMIELIQRSSFDDIFLGEIENAKLLIFLLRNGYIDETYQQYITYFYPGSLSMDDMRFIMSVKNQETLPFNYNLNKLQQVIQRLYANEFKRPEILNIHLLNFIINSGNNYTQFLKMILEQLSNGTERSIQFIEIFRKSTVHKEIFFEELCKEWSGMWKFVELGSMYSEETKEEYLLDILYYVSIENIQLLNQDNLLQKYVANKVNFLDLLLDDSKHQKINEIISTLQIKFKVISNSSGTKNVLRHIYLDNLYEINKSNIDLFLGEFGNPFIGAHSYNCIIKSNCTELIDYVNENISQYIENVYLTQEIIDEDESALVTLLNNSASSIDLRKGIIQQQKVLVSDLKEIVEPELWQILIINKKIRPTWENVIEYLEKYKLNEAAVSYLNQLDICHELSKYKLTELESDLGIDLQEISEMIIESDDICDDSFNEVSKSLHIFPQYSLSGLTTQRIQSLINTGVLSLSPENFIEIKQNSVQNLAILLIEKEPQKFLETLDKYKFNSEDILMLLHSRSFNLEQKWMIVQSLSVSELPAEIELAEGISKLALENGVVIGAEFLTYLMESEINVESKLYLVLSQIDNMENDEIMESMMKLGSPYSEITERKRPLIESNELTQRLVETLVQRDIISSYKDERGAIRVHTKQRMNG